MDKSTDRGHLNLVKFITENAQEILRENGIVTKEGLRERFEHHCKRYGVPAERAILLFEELERNNMLNKGDWR